MKAYFSALTARSVLMKAYGMLFGLDEKQLTPPRIMLAISLIKGPSVICVNNNGPLQVPLFVDVSLSNGHAYAFELE